MQGLAFQTAYKLPTTDQIRRMVTSPEFANEPSRLSYSELWARGVSGYVVNLSLTDRRDWSNFAVEKFRSGSFLYLELR